MVYSQVFSSVRLDLHPLMIRKLFNLNEKSHEFHELTQTFGSLIRFSFREIIVPTIHRRNNLIPLIKIFFLSNYNL